MLDSKKVNTYSRDAIMDDVKDILAELLTEWETQFEAGIGPETLLGADLSLGSIDIVRLISDIQQRYAHQVIPFQELFMRDDEIIQDLRVAELVDFLYRHFNQ